MTRVLLAGESWTTTSHHTKGFDTFFTSKYEEGAGPFLEVMASAGIDVEFMPNHVAMSRFPGTSEALSKYDVCILSDIGANTLSLPGEVFERSRTIPHRLEAIRGYVANGGSLLMIGGYLSFQGIQAMANYRNTCIAEVLPVVMEPGDDREECPDGVVASVTGIDHSITASLATSEWPHLLGYQRLTPKSGASVLVTVGDHPLLTVGKYGDGKTAAFASDMAPHWLPPEFLAWEGYGELFRGLVSWLAERDGE